MARISVMMKVATLLLMAQLEGLNSFGFLLSLSKG